MLVACPRKLWSPISLWCMGLCCSSEGNCDSAFCVLLCNKPCCLLLMRNVTFSYFLLCMNLYILLLFKSASKNYTLQSQAPRLFLTSAFSEISFLKRAELRLESYNLFIYVSTQCYLETLYEAFKGHSELNMQVWGKSYIRRNFIFIFSGNFYQTFGYCSVNFRSNFEYSVVRWQGKILFYDLTSMWCLHSLG